MEKARETGDFRWTRHRRYAPHLIELVRTGAIDPTKILTKVEPLTKVIPAYEAFDKREPGWIKVELKPAA